MAIRHPTIKKMITELRRIDKHSWGFPPMYPKEEALEKMYEKLVKLRMEIHNDWVNGKIM